MMKECRWYRTREFCPRLLSRMRCLKGLQISTEIGEDSPYYTRARRLCKFLHYFKDMEDENEIPPTSILREFIGGCTFYGE